MIQRRGETVYQETNLCSEVVSLRDRTEYDKIQSKPWEGNRSKTTSIDCLLSLKANIALRIINLTKMDIEPQVFTISYYVIVCTHVYFAF